MTAVEIQRVAGISRAAFAERYLADLGTPVIVTDATDQWPARSKWTFDYFKQAYGNDTVMAPLGLGGQAAKIIKLSSYIDHLGESPNAMPGFWVDTSDGRPLDAPPSGELTPLYLLGWSAFRRHPELHQDIGAAFYFADDWMASFEPELRDVFEWTSGREYWAIYVGPSGSLSPLHQDFWRTHTALAQIQGRKRLVLFSPDDGDYLYKGAVDPEAPDYSRFPLFTRATAYDCVLAPGETLFMPPDWWHFVRALDHSITLSHSFFNAANGSEHLTRILRKAPVIAKAIADQPEWREKLGIREPAQG